LPSGLLAWASVVPSSIGLVLCSMPNAAPPEKFTAALAHVVQALHAAAITSMAVDQPVGSALPREFPIITLVAPAIMESKRQAATLAMRFKSSGSV
jgi:hypothetical protein